MADESLAELNEGVQMVGRVVHVVDEEVLQTHTAISFVCVLLESPFQIGKSLMRDLRHEIIPGALYGRVEGYGQGKLLWFLGNPLNAVYDAAC